jgi:hypothetical protein
LLPGELGATEVTVSSGLLVDGLEQVKFLDDDTRTQVPVVSNDLNELSLVLVRGTVGLNEDGQWGGNTNSIGQLDSASTGNLGGDERDSNVSGNISTGTIDLGEILEIRMNALDRGGWVEGDNVPLNLQGVTAFQSP